MPRQSPRNSDESIDEMLEWLRNATAEDILNIPPLTDEEKEEMRLQGIDVERLEREPTEEELSEFHRTHPGFTDRVIALLEERQKQ
jgi:SHS2 domain-containing protein